MSENQIQVLVISILAVIAISIGVWAAIRRRRRVIIALAATGIAAIAIMILATLNTGIANSVTLLATLAAAAIAVASLWQTSDLEQRRAKEAMLNRILDWTNEALKVKSEFSISISTGLFGKELTSKDWEAHIEANRRLLVAKKSELLIEVERLCNELPNAKSVRTAIEKVISIFEHEDPGDPDISEQIEENCIAIVEHISNLRAKAGL
jgi:hypothetical protein